MVPHYCNSALATQTGLNGEVKITKCKPLYKQISLSTLITSKQNRIS